MLRKLFSCLLPQSKHARRRHKPKNLEARPDAVDTWAASLPNDLFLEILLRLEPAAVVCCAGVCKPWRRAIVDNVSILGPHLDRFFRPSLLLGILFHNDDGEAAAWLQRTPGPFQSALPSPSNGCVWVLFLRKMKTPANSLIPAAASAGALPTLVSSRDGFILLTARSRRSVSRLCLCNPVTGYCTIIPAAAGRRNTYILLTAGGSSSRSVDEPAVWILAVHRRKYYDDSSMMFLNGKSLAYQTIFVSTSGGDRAAARVWGPVVQSSFSDGELVPAGLCMRTDHRRTAVVSPDEDAVVYWLAGRGVAVTCVFALDVRTGRTWTTELPPMHQQCQLPERDDAYSSILATSGDDVDGRRLSLIRSLRGPKIQVWVLLSDDDNAGQWTLHRTIDVSRGCPTGGDIPRGSWIYLSAFCPRSRCVVATMWPSQELLIDVDGSGCIRRIGQRRKGHLCCPYEIDSSTYYISKMKHLLG